MSNYKGTIGYITRVTTLRSHNHAKVAKHSIMFFCSFLYKNHKPLSLTFSRAYSTRTTIELTIVTISFLIKIKTKTLSKKKTKHRLDSRAMQEEHRHPHNSATQQGIIYEFNSLVLFGLIKFFF